MELNWILILLVLTFVLISTNVLEHAATSPGTLVQLATSSTEHPYGYGYGYGYGHNRYNGYYGNPSYYSRGRYPSYNYEYDYTPSVTVIRDNDRDRGYTRSLNDAYMPFVFLLICLLIFIAYQNR